jgi:hypothetical protein
MEPVMSPIRVQLVESASGRAGFASNQARVEADATGNRNSIFNVFFASSNSGAQCEIAAPGRHFCDPQVQKILEKPQNPRFFGL